MDIICVTQKERAFRKTSLSLVILFNRSILNLSNRIRVFETAFESAFDAALSLMKNSKVGQQPSQVYICEKPVLPQEIFNKRGAFGFQSMLITLKAKIAKAFPCRTSCPSSFIGETERRFSARKKVHVSHLKLYGKGSNISYHAWGMPHTNPITDFENALVTGKDPNTAYTNESDVDMVIATDIQFFQNRILFSFLRYETLRQLHFHFS